MHNFYPSFTTTKHEFGIIYTLCIMNYFSDFIQQTEEDSLLIVRQMRQSFSLLLQGSDLDPCALTPGQMLLMGFNGLFTKLDADFTALLDAMSRLDLPEIWKKVDIVKEARSLQVCFDVLVVCIRLGLIF